MSSRRSVIGGFFQDNSSLVQRIGNVENSLRDLKADVELRYEVLQQVIKEAAAERQETQEMLGLLMDMCAKMIEKDETLKQEWQARFEKTRE